MAIAKITIKPAIKNACNPSENEDFLRFPAAVFFFAGFFMMSSYYRHFYRFLY